MNGGRGGGGGDDDPRRRLAEELAARLAMRKGLSTARRLQAERREARAEEENGSAKGGRAAEGAELLPRSAGRAAADVELLEGEAAGSSAGTASSGSPSPGRSGRPDDGSAAGLAADRELPGGGRSASRRAAGEDAGAAPAGSGDPSGLAVPGAGLADDGAPSGRSAAGGGASGEADARPERLPAGAASADGARADGPVPASPPLADLFDARTRELIEALGVLEEPAAERAPEAEAAGLAPAPRPVSIWTPQTAPAGTLWRRPAPSPLGDHYAARLEISAVPPPGVRRVCLFGESAAAGYLYAPHLTPAGVLEAQLGAVDGGGWEVVDLARSNERADTLAATVEAAAQLAPDHLVVYAGNNWKLLETTELSPWVPRVAARQELAAALAAEGSIGAARLARRRGAERAAAALERVAAVAARRGVPVTVVLPEVSLADWETLQPPPRLPADGTARWHAALRRALAALAAADRRSAGPRAAAGAVPPGRPAPWAAGAAGGIPDAVLAFGSGTSAAAPVAALAAGPLAAVEAAAWEMVALDGGVCPTPFRLLAAAHLAAAGAAEARGEPAAAHLAAARDSAVSEIDATHYPLLAFLAAPQADSAARRVTTAAARRHGFDVVDLREVLAGEGDGALPGRRLFLDYCHLTAEGMHRAMAAVAHALLRRAGSPAAERGWRRLAAELPPPWSGVPAACAAAAEATAYLGATVHTAHRHLPVTGRGELLDHWCAAALERGGEAAAAAMRDLAEARTAPGPELLSAAQARNLARQAPLLLQHGWRWPHLDGDLLAAMHRALAARRRPEADRLAALAAGRCAPPAGGLDLVHPPRHLAAPLARRFPEAMAPEGLAPAATLAALWPHTAFDLVLPAGGAPLRVSLTARLPGAAAEGTVEVSLDGRPAGRFRAGRTWCRVRLEIAAPAAAGPPPLFRRLTLHWPPPADAGPAPLAAAVRDLADGRAADLHPIHGELFSLHVGA